MSLSHAAGTLPLPYLGDAITLSLDMMLFLDCLLLSGYHDAPARTQLRLTYPAPEQRSMVVYQPPLPAPGAASAMTTSAGEQPPHPSYHALLHSAFACTLRCVALLCRIMN